MFSEEVKTPSGNVKRVVASTEQELRDAVEAVKNEPKQVTPDIDNPDHGNVVVSEFIADQKAALANRPPEHFPTSDASKELSRELAAAKSEEEKREVLKEAVQNSSTEEGLAQNVADKVEGKSQDQAVDGKKVDKESAKK